MKLSKKEQEIYNRCAGNCRICFNEGDCSLEKKLKIEEQKRIIIRHFRGY